MATGSFNALKKVRIKRFLAYTSISQVGFILLGVSSGNILGLSASLMYLIIYILMNLLFFTIFLNIDLSIPNRTRFILRWYAFRYLWYIQLHACIPS
jgi:NADH-quinone oxidoreductase subunit N